MDVDFWPSRVHSKHLSAAQAARYNSDHLAMDDSDGDEDTRAYFPCPFCYVDIEVHVLCSHLQNEHCFDLKNARRRKALKFGLWTGSSSVISKELSSFLGSSANGRANTNESAPDTLLSPFLGSGSHSHLQGSQQGESSNRTAHSESTAIYSRDGGEAVDSEERRLRAAFVQQLISSTIF
ncbi:hypothetical protein MANES_14G060400v8 [Manihot esculenta]|uniref:Uncharacterized protein n=1 Tax=Manihot esculenta TaxID=3983 RepID=A0ACB7GGA3_MANES|nr:hypothetical protein MANES_14G060400v8 [Manihot esculenta]